jgi:hypothetical protein
MDNGNITNFTSLSHFVSLSSTILIFSEVVKGIDIDLFENRPLLLRALYQDYEDFRQGFILLNWYQLEYDLQSERVESRKFKQIMPLEQINDCAELDFD